MKSKGYFFILGLAIGTLIGVLFWNFTMGILIGVVIGGIWEYIMTKKGEVPQMSEKEKKHNKWAWWIIIAFILLVIIWSLIANLIL